MPVINRGVNYDVPRQHQDVAIDPENVIALAELALAFYERFLQDAAMYFVDKE